MRAHSLAFAIFVGLPLAAATPSLVGCSKKAEAKTYATTGAIKSFSPDRKLVNIRHEDIPDYMKAMTMSFEVKNPKLIEGLSPGDQVSFKFADEDGRRVIVEITKK